MCAAGPEGGGGAGSAAVASAGEPVAGLGLTLQAAQLRRPHPDPHSPVTLAKEMCAFQNFRAETHISDSLIQPFCFTNGETKGQRSWFTHPNLHS